MNKPLLIQSLKSELTCQYDRALLAFAGSREAATGADTKAENKYDTRGLEASYLAAGQAEQVEGLRLAVSLLDAFVFPDFELDSPIAQGALVETDIDDEIIYYLIAPAGGGLVLNSDTGESVTVIGPGSPLAAKLIGKTTGDILSDPDLMILEVS